MDMRYFAGGQQHTHTHHNRQKGKAFTLLGVYTDCVVVAVFVFKVFHTVSVTEMIRNAQFKSRTYKKCLYILNKPRNVPCLEIAAYRRAFSGYQTASDLYSD